MPGELGEVRKYVYEAEKNVKGGMLILNMEKLRVYLMLASYRMLLFEDPATVML